MNDLDKILEKLADHNSQPLPDGMLKAINEKVDSEVRSIKRIAIGVAASMVLLLSINLHFLNQSLKSSKQTEMTTIQDYFDLNSSQLY